MLNQLYWDAMNSLVKSMEMQGKTEFNVEIYSTEEDLASINAIYSEYEWTAGHIMSYGTYNKYLLTAKKK